MCSSKQHIRRTVPECHNFRGVSLSGDGLGTSKACKKTQTNKKVLLPVQRIGDNNWKQDIIFSWIFKHKQSQCSLQAIDKESVSGIYLWGTSDQSICGVVQGFTICDWSSHLKPMPRKPFGSALCGGLYMLHYFLKRWVDSQFSWISFVWQ